MKNIIVLFTILLSLTIEIFAYDEQYIEEQFDLGEGTVLRSHTKYRDGGTELFSFEDNWGNELKVYIDGRIDSETIGSLFIDDYPGAAGKRIEKGSRPEEKLLYMLRDIYLYNKIDLEDDLMSLSTIKAALKAVLIEKAVISDAEEDGIVSVAVKDGLPANEKEAFQLAFNNCEIGQSFTTGAKGFALYKYTIIEPDIDGCIVESQFLENINPEYVGKTMQCIYDNTKPFLNAVKSMDRCEGDLYDFMFERY